MLKIILGKVFGFFGGLQTKTIEIGIVVLMIILSYWYWNHSQDKIHNLEQANASLITTNKTQDDTINSLQENFKKNQDALTELNKNYGIVTENLKKKTSFKFQNVTSKNKSEVEKTINQYFKDYSDTVNNETKPDSF